MRSDAGCLPLEVQIVALVGLFSALEYLADLRMIHRDVKPVGQHSTPTHKYTHTHLHTHTHMHARTHAHIHTYIHTSNVHARTYVHIKYVCGSYAQRCIDLHMNPHVCVLYIYVCVCVCKCVCVWVGG